MLWQLFTFCPKKRQLKKDGKMMFRNLTTCKPPENLGLHPTIEDHRGSFFNIRGSNNISELLISPNTRDKTVKMASARGMAFSRYFMYPRFSYKNGEVCGTLRIFCMKDKLELHYYMKYYISVMFAIVKDDIKTVCAVVASEAFIRCSSPARSWSRR